MNMAFSSSESSADPVRLIDRQSSQTFNFGYRMPLPALFVHLVGCLPRPGWPTGATSARLPSSMNYTVAGSRRAMKKLQRGDADTTRQETFTVNETYAAKLNPLTGLSADYNLRIDRDLRKKLDPRAMSFGREVGRKQTADVTFTLRWLDQNYTFKASYNEQNDPTQRRSTTLVDSVSDALLALISTHSTIYRRVLASRCRLYYAA